jgi:hypothetical protein
MNHTGGSETRLLEVHSHVKQSVVLAALPYAALGLRHVDETGRPVAERHRIVVRSAALLAGLAGCFLAGPGLHRAHGQ